MMTFIISPLHVIKTKGRVCGIHRGYENWIRSFGVEKVGDLGIDGTMN
jgi:hypothetical protein